MPWPTDPLIFQVAARYHMQQLILYYSLIRMPKMARSTWLFLRTPYTKTNYVQLLWLCRPCLETLFQSAIQIFIPRVPTGISARIATQLWESGLHRYQQWWVSFRRGPVMRSTCWSRFVGKEWKGMIPAHSFLRAPQWVVENIITKNSKPPN